MDQKQVRSLVCIWILFFISSIVMVLRIISQFRILRIVRADDILMIIAWILQAVKTALATVCIHWGLGLHEWQMPSRYAFVNVMKYEMYTMLFGTLCGMFGRVAFAAFLLYFMQRVSRKRTYVIWAVIVVQVVVSIVLLVIELVRCAPVVQNPHAAMRSANCWMSEAMLHVQYSQGAVNAASNLCLTILALSLVMGIHAPGYAKTGLGILLSFSLLATIANILDIIEVHQSRVVGNDYTYRLNTWNYWYSIENAVIIVTASMPKVRPVFLVVYQRMRSSRAVEKLKRWSNSKGPTSLRFRFFRLSGTRNSTNSRRSSPPRSPPSIRGRVVADEEELSPPSILQRLKSGNSIYSRKSRNNINNSSNNSSSRRNNYWHKNNHHRRHLSSSSGGTFSLSSFPRSSHSVGIWDSKDITRPSFDQTSTISRDFVPVSSPRLAYQTVISAGDPSVPPPPPPLPPPFISLPAPTAVASVPSGFSTPNGGSSGRTSRSSKREQPQQQDGFTTTNSSFIFLPVTVNNNSNNNNNNSATYQPPEMFPILQTNYFSIEYENVNQNNNGPTIYWNTGNTDNQHHRNTSETSRHQHHRHHDVELGWATMRHNDHQEDMNSNIYNEDDANALQLHDVGSILNSEGNQH